MSHVNPKNRPVTYSAASKPAPKRQDTPERAAEKSAAKRAVKAKKRKSITELQLDNIERNQQLKKEGKTPTLEIYC